VWLSACREDEGRDLYRKRGSEFKLPYPIIDINGCDSPQSSLAVSSSTGDDGATTTTPLARPLAGRKPPASTAAAGPRGARKRKKDGGSLAGLYSGGEIKGCGEVMNPYDAGLAEAVYRGGAGYHDAMMACADYGRVQPTMIGRYDEEGVAKMRNDDYRCYYDNGVTPSGGGAAWYWAQQDGGAQLASYLYDQQRYLADYSVYGRLVTSPPASLSNGYDALPVATAGALYEAPTPPEDDDGCLRAMSATTTAFPHRPRDGDATAAMSGSCARNDDADLFVASGNNNNNNDDSGIATAVGVTSVGLNGAGQHAGYGVATPVIQMTAKSRYDFLR